MTEARNIFSRAALENIEETGANWRRDLEQLLGGSHTPATLLEFCLDGAEPDREQGWRDYVAALEALMPARDDGPLLWGSLPTETTGRFW